MTYNNEIPKKRVQCGVLENKEHLCWSCKNAYSGCSWSVFYKPVNGWVAYKSNVSYLVHKCPQYKYDGKCSTCIFSIGEKNIATFSSKCDRCVPKGGCDCGGYVKRQD